MKHFQIQNLSDRQLESLERLKRFTGEATMSKAVMLSVDYYPDKVQQIESYRHKINSLESQLSSLRSEIRTYFDLQESLKSEGENN